MTYREQKELFKILKRQEIDAFKHQEFEKWLRDPDQHIFFKDRVNPDRPVNYRDPAIYAAFTTWRTLYGEKEVKRKRWNLHFRAVNEFREVMNR